jgi:hypothetical protein
VKAVGLLAAAFAFAAGAQDVKVAEPAQATPEQPAQPAPSSPCPPGTVPAAQQPAEGPFICVQVQPPASTPETANPPADPTAAATGNASASPSAPATATNPAADQATNPTPPATTAPESPLTPSAAVPAPAKATEPPRSRGAPEPTEEELAEATRALERALVQQGGLTLRPGRFELVPELTYSFSEGNALLRTGGGDVNVGTRSEIYAGAVTLRVGLPLRFQVEATAPFIWSRWTGLTENADDPAAIGSGIGDVTLAATWQPLRAFRNLPDLLVSGFWKARNGESALDDPDVLVPVGSGIETFGGSVSLLKALDPVVLLVSGTYAHAVPRWAPFGWLDAGDELGATASAVLAVSPETSLSFGLEQSYAQRIRVDEVPIPHSDRTSATFRVGVTTLASRHGMLEVNLGIGLTREVPRFEVNVATPLQF